MQSEKFDTWAIIEMMGHQKLAGKCSEQSIAGANFLRVDVPETKHTPAFTRYLGSSAIYAINPVDEPIAREAAENMYRVPVLTVQLQDLVRKQIDADERFRIQISEQPKNDTDDEPF